MRKVFFTIIFIFSVGLCFSQTAYYDALELMRWYRLGDSDPQKSKEAALMLGKMLKYSSSRSAPLANDNNLFLNRIYHKADTLYSFVKRKEIPKPEVVEAVLKADTSVLKKTGLFDLRMKHRSDSASLAAFNNLLKTYKNRYEIFIRHENNFAAYKSSVKELVKKFPDESNVPDIDAIFTLDPFSKMEAIQLDSLLKNIYEEEENRLRSVINIAEEDIYYAVMALSTNEIRRIIKRMNLVAEELGRAENEAERLIAKAMIEEESNTPGSEKTSPQQLADLNFPTQSEIIDAIAIYLARRVKQEATLSFIENLNRIIKTDDLAQDLFPQTWLLMQTEEAYISPRFNTQWRNAIAADYLSLPQNIITSKYIDSRIADENLKKYFHDAVTFGSLVARKYNFADIIRTLFSDQKTLLKGKWTTISINVLHIINQEFIDTTKGRQWIAPKDFYDRDTSELYCIYDLVKLRYKNDVCQDLQTIFNKIDDFKNRVSEIKKFYNELLVVLQQFDVVQSAAFADGKTMIKDGFWDTQRILISFLQQQRLFKLTTREHRALSICEKGFFVYDYISNKNYVAAADNIIQIIELLTGNTPKSLINLTARELETLRSKAAGVADKLVNNNIDFSNLIVIRYLSDTIQLAIKKGILNSTDILTPAYLFDRFHFWGDETNIRKSIFPVSNSITADELQKNVGLFDNSLVKKIQSDYETIVADVRKNLPALKTGKFIYRDAKKLTDNLLAVAHYYIKDENGKYFKWLADFSGLLTEVAASKGSKELANVIESYAKPPGSYRLKRNSSFSIDINAYAGAYIAREKIKGQDKFKTAYGIIAPLGIAFSFGSSRVLESGRDKKLIRYETSDKRKLYVNKKGVMRQHTGNSFTIDLSIIDIGTVVSYRFTEGEDKGLPKDVKWSQVLAPGVSLRWGIRGLPLCIGLGMQRAPELRSFNGELTDAYRVQLSLAFDLPLFGIWHSR